MSLECENVAFSYGKTAALRGLSASLGHGVFGLLGANGAGKTTLISLIVRLLNPQQGQILYNGQDIRRLGNAYFDHIGYLPQSPRFYSNYTIREFLRYMAALKGMKKRTARDRAEEMLAFVNLTDVGGRKLGRCSGGMRQRAGIAQAMLNNPDVLILDEPTAGLDPLERIRFRNLISRLGEDRTVLLATHIVSDVEYIARDILLLKDGVMVQQGPPAALTETMRGRVWELSVEEKDVGEYLRRYRVSSVRPKECGYWLRIVDEEPPEGAGAAAPSLEDVYLWHFGGQDHDVDPL